MEGRLRFELLGPVHVWRGSARLPAGPPQLQLVLAVLVLAGERPVSTDRLVEALWGERPPRTARGVVSTYLSRLRGVLGAQAVVSGPAGHALTESASDVADFTDLIRRKEYGEALRLWRGEPLAGLDGDWAAARRAQLKESMLTAREAWLEQRLAQDRHAEVITELTELCAAYPFRENLRRLLMLALHRSGRRAEALAVFTDTQTYLVEELGIEPSPALAELRRTILDAETPPAAPSVPAAVPAQLPADLADFTGRAEQVAQITEVLTRPGTLPIVTVSGGGGVGKTSLAVHGAHRVRDRFPDGQLHVDLRGAGPDPVPPAGVLARFLRALGVGERRIPESLADRSALFRSVLAGRRVLLVLDNAASAAQVTPLLPGGDGCAVLVTSRARMTDLPGARVVDLAALDPAEATGLFVAVVGAHRVRPEPEAVADVVAACGYLPLAVRVAAARIASRPSWRIADLAARLADERTRLAQLRVQDTSVESSFALSYGQLSEPQARAFRLLAVPETQDVPLAAAQALLGLDEDETEELCENLVDLNLLQSRAPARYGYHDLLRVYARGQAGAESAAALDRLMDFCLASTRRAVHLLNPQSVIPEGVPTTAEGLDFAGRDAAGAWMRGEWPWLLAATRQFLKLPGAHPLALTELAVSFQNVRDNGVDVDAIVRAMRDAAGRAAEQGERQAETWARTAAGFVLLGRDRPREAGEEMDRARELLEGRQDPVLEVRVINSQAMARWNLGRRDEGLAIMEQAVAAADDAAEQLGVYPRVVMHANLSAMLREQGRTDEAVDRGLHALAIADPAGDVDGGAITRLHLGLAHLQAERPGEAIVLLERAAEMFERLRNPWQAARCHGALARALMLEDRDRQAVAHAERAVALSDESGQELERGRSRRLLADVLDRIGQTDRALACRQEALEVFERIGAPEAAQIRAALRS
ncbi:AfsR/SARP family transcriptional regulator [Nonomuraea typhae]|uniref:AfsR/SARP family transcriptional regulator n=1 Tax=Nonomuraea typhae TaxID=2603600 RepID=UPI0012F9D9F8|nr:BTAD domain-containing putative transcriptional regulator [Nonomuraea typhae]